MDWGPRRGQRKVVPERRSSQRVEELKRAQSKSRSDTREQLEKKSCQPQANSKAKVDTRPKSRRAERSQPALSPGLALRRPPQAVAPGMSQIPSMEKQLLAFICIKVFFLCYLEVDARICTTEQRKLEVSEMHQRTRRYSQSSACSLSQGPESPSSDPQLICADCTSSWRRCSSRKQSRADSKPVHRTG